MATQKKVRIITDKNFHEAITNNSMIIIDCWAAWCGPCRILSPIIEELAEQHHGKIVFGKLNVDENSAIVRKFKIMAIPTILFFRQGKLKDTLVGAVPKSAINEKIQQMM